jgi:ParB-like chromosome segregation protein Spo0J
MKTSIIPIDQIKLDPRNPRTISIKDFESLKKSIKKFGLVEPVIVNKPNMLLIGGHQRTRAAIELGLTEVPVVWVELDDKQATALAIALNKIAGDFDEDMLAELIADLDDLISFTGFDDDELAKLQADPFSEDTNELIEPTVPKVDRYTVEQLRTLAKSYHPVKADEILEFLAWVEQHSKRP